MAALLQVHRLAWRELDLAAERYGGDLGGIGGFIDAAEQTVALIASHPLVGRVVYRTRRGVEIRQFRIRRFPYAIVYTTTESPPSIFVFAVAHAKRRPRYWSRRLQRD